MLRNGINPNDSVARIIGIDPGSNKLGISVLSFDVITMEIVHTEAHTFVGGRLGKNTWETEIHGDKYGRIDALGDNLFQFFWDQAPTLIASEGPFMSITQPSAFMPLVEVMCAIRAAMMRYDPWMVLHVIDPPTVKVAVGAPGHIGGERGKENVKQGLLRILPVLKYQGAVPFEKLSEHARDAMAVAYCRFLMYLKELQLCFPAQK